MYITAHGKLNNQTGKGEVQAQKTPTRPWAVRRGKTNNLQRRKKPDRTCILRNLNDYISDEHRAGVDEGTRALHDHGTVRATTTIANAPPRQPAKTASTTRLQTSRLVRMRINETKDEVPIFLEHIHTAPLPAPTKVYVRSRADIGNCGASRESNWVGIPICDRVEGCATTQRKIAHSSRLEGTVDKPTSTMSRTHRSLQQNVFPPPNFPPKLAK